jgi:hypothetical protein
MKQTYEIEITFYFQVCRNSWFSVLHIHLTPEVYHRLKVDCMRFLNKWGTSSGFFEGLKSQSLPVKRPSKWMVRGKTQSDPCVNECMNGTDCK